MAGRGDSTLRFAQRSGYSLSVLWRVDSGRSAASHDHSNSYSILQRAQLLEGFRAFQWRSFPANETQQQIARVSVDPLMAKIFRFLGRLTDKRNRRARKIKGVAVLIHHDFHLMRRLRVVSIFERMR